MDLLRICLSSGLCLLIAAFFYWLLWDSIRSSMDEVGYRSPHYRQKRFKRKPNQPLWDYLAHWTLYKNAKRNPEIVRIYFILNLVLLGAGAVSVVLALVCPVVMDREAGLIVPMGFSYGFFLLHNVIRFVLDLTYVPSVRKKHRLKDE